MKDTSTANGMKAKWKYVCIGLSILLISVTACHDDPPQAPPSGTLQSDSLILLSYLEPAEVSSRSYLTLEWKAQLGSAADSIVIEAVNNTSPGGMRQLQTRPGSDGTFSVQAGDVGFQTFRFRLRTLVSGIIRETAPIRLRDEARDIWFAFPAQNLSVWETDTLHIRWASVGLDANEAVMLSIRTDENQPWSIVNTLRAVDTVVDLPVQSLGRTVFNLKLAPAKGDIAEISARIRVLPSTWAAPIAVLAPRNGDTLIWHRDALEWVPAPGSENKITELEVRYREMTSSYDYTRRFPGTRHEIPLSEIILRAPEETPFRASYIMYIRALPDTHSIQIGPFFVFDFRFITRLENATLRRGTVLDIKRAHTGFGDLIPWRDYRNSSSETPVHYFLSMDGGASWNEENEFAWFNSLGACGQFLTARVAGECLLRMVAVRGARTFADTTGPFSIIDRTSPLFEWNIGSTFRYKYDTLPYSPTDTLTVQIVGKVDDGKVITYTLREYSARTGQYRTGTIWENKNEMSRLSGWKIPGVNVYRYADSDEDEYSVYSYQVGYFSASVTVRRQKGLLKLYERTGSGGGPPFTSSELTLIE
ncbi:MAG: hypothetical protein WC824_07475 [Bacteroidota bacterium]|jgi:hypothetical protein